MKILGKTSSLTDAELVERYQKTHNQEVLAKIFNRYAHLIFGVCLKYLKNREEAKDALMAIYEIISSKLGAHKVENFGGWVYSVTKNHCLGELRKDLSRQEHQKKWEKDMESSQDWHPIEENNLEQQLAVLEKCIETLNKEQKTCVHLFYLKKKSYQEVTNLTGHALNKVKSYIQNGKRNLKNCIEVHLEK